MLFKTKGQKLNHMRIHENRSMLPGNTIQYPKRNGLFVCVYCPAFKASRKWHAKRHMERFHSTKAFDQYSQALYAMALEKKSENTRYGLVKAGGTLDIDEDQFDVQDVTNSNDNESSVSYDGGEEEREAIMVENGNIQAAVVGTETSRPREYDVTVSIIKDGVEMRTDDIDMRYLLVPYVEVKEEEKDDEASNGSETSGKNKVELKLCIIFMSVFRFIVRSGHPFSKRFKYQARSRHNKNPK